jgi:hypothetical protein
MKTKIEGNSTIITYEKDDYTQGVEAKDRDKRVIDKGGVVILCPSEGDCRSTVRAAAGTK